MTEHMSRSELSEVQSGLRMTHPPDPVELAAERVYLASLENALRCGGSGPT